MLLRFDAEVDGDQSPLAIRLAERHEELARSRLKIGAALNNRDGLFDLAWTRLAPSTSATTISVLSGSTAIHSSCGGVPSRRMGKNSLGMASIARSCRFESNSDLA